MTAVSTCVHHTRALVDDVVLRSHLPSGQPHEVFPLHSNTRLLVPLYVLTHSRPHQQAAIAPHPLRPSAAPRTSCPTRPPNPSQRLYPAATRPLRRSAGDPTSTRSTPGYVGASPHAQQSPPRLLFPTASVPHSRSRDHFQRYLVPNAQCSRLLDTSFRGRSPSPMPPRSPRPSSAQYRSRMRDSRTYTPRASPPPGSSALAVALHPRAPSQLAIASTFSPFLFRACRAPRCDPPAHPVPYSIAHPAPASPPHSLQPHSSTTRLQVRSPHGRHADEARWVEGVEGDSEI
ncbi:hypothetical protein B0H19DRAFT_601665 [Mycena capillaripes]|nr:hypothetical protein B0H19DRAFT_601665 [Mycena capillaripes]